MDNALMVGLSAQQVLRKRMDITANNLANLNTTAFKAEALIMREMSERPAEAVERPEDILFVEDWGLNRNMSEGPLQHTGSPLDIAIRHDGFLTVEGPDGDQAFTRDGRLMIDADGVLQTRISGWPVLGASGEQLKLDPEGGDIRIGADGSVRQGENEIGRLRLVNFPTPGALEKAADGLWFQTDEAPQDVAEPDIAPGYLEGSNVNAIFELSRMIEISRTYQSVSRTLEQSGELRRGAIERLADIGLS